MRQGKQGGVSESGGPCEGWAGYKVYRQLCDLFLVSNCFGDEQPGMTGEQVKTANFMHLKVQAFTTVQTFFGMTKAGILRPVFA